MANGYGMIQFRGGGEEWRKLFGGAGFRNITERGAAHVTVPGGPTLTNDLVNWQVSNQEGTTLGMDPGLCPGCHS
jgi:hypothetical protein